MNAIRIAGVCACVLTLTAVGCGDDEPLEGGTGGKGGTATGGKGGKGGTDGGSSGGSSGSGGSEAGTGASGGTAGSGGGDSGPPPGKLLVAGTDFATTTEVVTIDLTNNQVVGTASFADGDAVPASSFQRGFVIERTKANVNLLDATGKIEKTISVGKGTVGASGTGSSNPVAVAINPITLTQGWVVLQDVNKVALADFLQGVTGNVDLAAYQVPGDNDGSVDAGGAVFRPVGPGRLYFFAGRIDRTTIASPNFQLACPTQKALLLAVEGNALVDLNGTGSGEGIELSLVNPVELAYDAAQNRMLVLSAGCFQPGDGGATRVLSGIEAVDLTAGTVTTLYPSPNQDYLARLLVLGPSSAIVGTFDPSFIEHWYSYSLGNALGSPLTGVPTAPSVDDQDHVFGMRTATTDAGSSVEVVRYEVSSMQWTTVVTSPFTGSATNPAGTAVVRF